MTQIEIIEQAKLKASFGFIYRNYAKKLYQYFWYRVGYRKSVAEDLTQETFVRAYQKFSQFENRGFSYLTYLMSIAHNQLVNYYRRTRPVSLDQAGDIPVETTPKVETEMEIERLWQAVDDLTANEKDVMFMKYQREMSVREISQVMDKSENAVKLLLSRARKKLAEHPFFQTWEYSGAGANGALVEYF